MGEAWPQWAVQIEVRPNLSSDMFEKGKRFSWTASFEREHQGRRVWWLSCQLVLLGSSFGAGIYLRLS